MKNPLDCDVSKSGKCFIPVAHYALYQLPITSECIGNILEDKRWPNVYRCINQSISIRLLRRSHKEQQRCQLNLHFLHIKALVFIEVREQTVYLYPSILTTKFLDGIGANHQNAIGSSVWYAIFRVNLLVLILKKKTKKASE